jgi:hypothetical protein
VVAEQRWIEWLAKAMDPIVSCEIHHFPPELIEQARPWLHEDVAPAPGERS